MFNWLTKQKWFCIRFKRVTPVGQAQTLHGWHGNHRVCRRQAEQRISWLWLDESATYCYISVLENLNASLHYILGFRALLGQRLWLDYERVTPLQTERLLDEILNVFETRVTALTNKSWGRLGICAKRTGNANQSSGSKSADGCWRHFCVVFQRPNQDVVSLFLFISTLIERQVLR